MINDSVESGTLLQPTIVSPLKKSPIYDIKKRKTYSQSKSSCNFKYWFIIVVTVFISAFLTLIPFRHRIAKRFIPMCEEVNSNLLKSNSDWPESTLQLLSPTARFAVEVYFWTKAGGSLSQIGGSEITSLKSIGWTSIDLRCNPDHVNFLSIDKEGDELKILSRIDFFFTDFDVIVIRVGPKTALEAARDFLVKKGFMVDLKKNGRSWFYRRDFEASIRTDKITDGTQPTNDPTTPKIQKQILKETVTNSEGEKSETDTMGKGSNDTSADNEEEHAAEVLANDNVEDNDTEESKSNQSSDIGMDSGKDENPDVASASIVVPSGPFPPKGCKDAFADGPIQLSYGTNHYEATREKIEQQDMSRPGHKRVTNLGNWNAELGKYTDGNKCKDKPRETSLVYDKKNCPMISEAEKCVYEFTVCCLISFDT